MDLNTLSPEAFGALRLAFNDIWTQPEARFPLANVGARSELLDAQVIVRDGTYFRLTAEGLAVCKATFGALIEKELAAQAQGGVLRIPFKGR